MTKDKIIKKLGYIKSLLDESLQELNINEIEQEIDLLIGEIKNGKR